LARARARQAPPAGRLVRFVVVRHPLRGTIFLLATDLTLEPMEIILLYGYRFKIELGFPQAVHIVGSYAYHFWMATIKPRRRGQGDQYLHRESQAYRDAVRRKRNAFHLHVQLGFRRAYNFMASPRRPTFSRCSTPSTLKRIHQMPEPGTFSKMPRSLRTTFLGIGIVLLMRS
jgi:hypothetical protein